MKENKFIHQNKQKWLNFEQGLKNKSSDVEDWSRFFIQLSDDLSYARTHYPNRSVRVYLNSLMQLVFHKVIRKRRFSPRAVKEFWTREIPFIFYSVRKELLLSFIIFSSAILIGAVSTHYDIDFPRAILGDDYVDMTIQNIKNGDPMGVYKHGNTFTHFLMLTYNNLMVACITFVLGITAGLGTAVYLTYNGIMLGAFQYFFFKYGVLKVSLLTVWMHGSLEISAIVIAGAAGFTLTKGLLFPGTYTRAQALRIHGVNAAGTMVGTIPLFIAAGFIEIFITRFTDWDEWLRAIFIIACLVFVMYYVIILPRKKFKGVTESPLNTLSRPQAEQEFTVVLTEIKPNGKILEEVFGVFRRSMKMILRVSAVLALLFTFTLMVFDASLLGKELKEEGLYLFVSLFNPADNHLLQCIFFSLALAVLSVLSARWIRNNYDMPLWEDLFSAKLPLRFLVFFAGSLVIFADTRFNALFFMLIESLLLLMICVRNEENIGLLTSSGRALSLFSSSFVSYTGLVVVCIIIGSISYLVLNSTVVYTLIWFISWNMMVTAGTMTYVTLLIAVFINTFIVMCVFAFLCISFQLFYFSASEAMHAGSLKKRIAAIP
jgi:uncharacterized membrane protein SpoIIM required for sporulation